MISYNPSHIRMRLLLDVQYPQTEAKFINFCTQIGAIHRAQGSPIPSSGICFRPVGDSTNLLLLPCEGTCSSPIPSSRRCLLLSSENSEERPGACLTIEEKGSSYQVRSTPSPKFIQNFRGAAGSTQPPVVVVPYSNYHLYGAVQNIPITVQALIYAHKDPVNQTC